MKPSHTAVTPLAVTPAHAGVHAHSEPCRLDEGGHQPEALVACVDPGVRRHDGSWRWQRPVAALLCLTAFGAQAASQFEFSVWMRAIDQRSVSVQKHIAARNLDPARADAHELERLYALMERYFEHDYPAEDAVKVSRDGRQQAALIPAALDRSAYDEAAKAAREIALACNDCHDPYKPFK